VVELQSIIHRLTEAASVAVLATLVTVEGSSYRRPGARLLLQSNGRRTGSISGGCLEEDLLAHCHQVQLSGVAQLVRYDTSSENDLVWGVGLGCHGIVQLLVEKVQPNASWAETVKRNFGAHIITPLAVVWASPDQSLLGTHLLSELPKDLGNASVFHQRLMPPVELFVFGAGDDARPLVRMAKELGWRVTVGDPRRDFATKERFPSADVLVVAAAHELVHKANVSDDALAVVMTHHYVHDVPLIAALAARGLPYLGLLGPKKRAIQIINEVTRTLDEDRRRGTANIHAPVGLDLGAETPEEVALSIIAEMKAILSGRDGRPLRNRNRPIHE
jgi:xanthine dehydrogenase accessory factor